MNPTPGIADPLVPQTKGEPPIKTRDRIGQLFLGALSLRTCHVHFLWLVTEAHSPSLNSVPTGRLPPSSQRTPQAPRSPSLRDLCDDWRR